MFEGVASPDISSGLDYEYGLLRETCGVRELTELSIIEFSGDDRKGWLQGQVTNDMRPVDVGTSISFCFCNATGQIQAPCTLWGLAERFLILTPKAAEPAVFERVEKMVILESVEARDVTNEYRLMSVQGPWATQRLGEYGTLPTLEAGVLEIAGEEVIVLRSNRTGYGGWDVLVPKDSAGALAEVQKAFEKVGDAAWDIARLEAGIPVFGRDIVPEKTMPPELGQKFEALHVNYGKGCYMGQEVLMRIHSRGHTNKTWMGLSSDRPIPVGATLSHTARKEAGVVTSSVESPDYGFIAAAMVRNEAAFEGEILLVQSDDGTFEAEARHMPLLRTY